MPEMRRRRFLPSSVCLLVDPAGLSFRKWCFCLRRRYEGFWFSFELPLGLFGLVSPVFASLTVRGINSHFSEPLSHGVVFP